ncbi:streptococcal pyrogenic exotoxin SpeG [Streptococcus pyogenes]|uniref:streptococcal pyrogenic exotoxin SpeG n=1 Tax=Streptococcus pyogenes TaxID=1314 RepID=UPI0010A1046B|nr:streptococcal pyrogenic exotoxin SpeG [Streptococcus pyogenes]VGQ41339.1 exotoxin G [Streptococcus pyogenes]VGQ69107.1 exotoxin G [Streptococcus pyogenes]VHB20184.1 exotoxin G [Streptococcus pyogenes]VHB49255.1 exotoxin G [Streptococcus pyogenes]VHD43766.1 exotoxin G [Streptococcus pyogenes]
MKTNILTIIILSCVFSYGSQLAYADENLKDLKRSLRFAYNITPCDYENVEIAFVTTNSIHINTKQKRSECILYVDSIVSLDITDQFIKGDKVDVFGLPYNFSPPYVDNIYGGIVKHSNQGNKSLQFVGILNQDGKETYLPSEVVRIKKKQFTLQEFDFKIRKFLMEKYNIYDSESRYTSGSLFLATKDSKHYEVDLFNKDDKLLSRDSFFKRYKDNKIFNSEEISHFDIYLKTH